MARASGSSPAPRPASLPPALPPPPPRPPASPAAGDDFWSEVDQQLYQPNTFRVIEHVLSRAPRGVYADLGSYVGPTVLFAAHFAASVLAVETDPQAFSTLNANVHLNPRVESRTRLVFGCAGDGGVAEFAGSGLPDSRRKAGVLPDGLREDRVWGLKTGSKWTHECRPLGALLEGAGLDARALALVNVDIVGSELLALPGLRTALAARGAGSKKPAVLLHVYAPLWDATAAVKQKAWDVVATFAFVYDGNFQPVPRSATPAFCEELGCTMLLSDVEISL